MQRCHQKDATAFSIAFFGVFKVRDLHDDRYGLSQIDPTQYRDEEFLADDDTRHGHNAAKGEAARVAPEHLSGVTVPPLEADTGANHR